MTEIEKLGPCAEYPRCNGNPIKQVCDYCQYVEPREKVIAQLQAELSELKGKLVLMGEVAKQILSRKDCPMCDFGKLRNPEKEHWPECGYYQFEQALSTTQPDIQRIRDEIRGEAIITDQPPPSPENDEPVEVLAFIPKLKEENPRKTGWIVGWVYGGFFCTPGVGYSIDSVKAWMALPKKEVE